MALSKVEELDEEFQNIEERGRGDEAVYVFDPHEHMKLIVANLDRMRRSDILVDLKISNQEGECLDFHSPLIAAASSHFCQYFSDTQIHFHSGRLDLHNHVDATVLRALQQYLYEPERQMEVSDWTKLMEFSSTFGFYKMVNGKGELKEYLINLQEMKNKYQMTYTVLQTADDNQFLCHSCVVAAASPYLCERLTAENVPANCGRLRLILPTQIQSEAVAPILDFIYRATVKINWENAEALLSASSVCRCPAIARVCTDFIRKRLNASNAIHFEIKSREMMTTCGWECLSQLNLNAKELISANIETVLDSASFALLLNEEGILKYLGASDTTKLSLGTLLQALLRWRAAESGRDSSFARLVAVACHILDKEGLNKTLTTFQLYYGRTNGMNTQTPSDNQRSQIPNLQQQQTQAIRKDSHPIPGLSNIQNQHQQQQQLQQQHQQRRK